MSCAKGLASYWLWGVGLDEEAFLPSLTSQMWEAEKRGAAVAFGLIGMAWEIKTRDFRCPRCNAWNKWDTACCWRCSWEPDEGGTER